MSASLTFHNKPAATGSQQIAHGLGVTPVALIFFLVERNSADFSGAAWGVNNNYSIGFWGGGSQGCGHFASEDGDTAPTAASSMAPDRVMYMTSPLGSATVYASASVTGVDATNVTLNWGAMSDAVARKFACLALGGGTMQAKVVSFQTPSGSADTIQDITTLGLDPDTLFFLSNGVDLANIDASDTPNSYDAGRLAFGGFSADGSGWTLSNYSHDTGGVVANSQSMCGMDEGEYSSMTNGGQAFTNRFRVLGMRPGGFRMQTLRYGCAQGSDVSRTVYVLGISGLKSHFGFFDAPAADPGVLTVRNGSGLTPEAVLLATTYGRVANPDGDAVVSGNHFAFGMAIPGGNQCCYTVFEQYFIATSNVESLFQGASGYLGNNTDLAGTESAATVASAAGGMTFDWTTYHAGDRIYYCHLSERQHGGYTSVLKGRA